MKKLIVILYLIPSPLLFIQCQTKENKTDILKEQADFKIDYCSATYKEKELPYLHFIWSKKTKAYVYSDRY